MKFAEQRKAPDAPKPTAEQVAGIALSITEKQGGETGKLRRVVLTLTDKSGKTTIVRDSGWLERQAFQAQLALAERPLRDFITQGIGHPTT